MLRKTSRLWFWRTAGPATLVALSVTSLGPVALTTSAASTSSSQIVTWGEQPNAPPSYISPIASDDYFSPSYRSQFSELMYRPLYWFGDNGKPVLNPSLSLAAAPKYSNDNNTVTIDMKHWLWSDGQPITARDVIFFLNVVKASVSPGATNIGNPTTPGPGWGAYVSGLFPENVASYSATGTYTVVMQLSQAYNPTWFTYNELSQITPIPQHAWDRTSAGSPIGNYDQTLPGTAATGALAVAQYINSESQHTSTYATNPMWRVVSGPFKIAQFTVHGYAKLVPNTRYSGPDQPHIKAFEEIPFTSSGAELKKLQGRDLTIGYLPPGNYAQLKLLEQKGYKANYWNIYSTNFMTYDFSNPQAGPLFQQLYIRRAIQSLVNQKLIIKDYYPGGIGSVNNGPVPTYPSNTVANPFLSTLEAGPAVYPYDPAKAVSLLKGHGWTVQKAGTSFCSKPGIGTGECGAGIKNGEKLQFTFLFSSAGTVFTDEMTTIVAAWKQQAGITAVVRTPLLFGEVAADAHTPGYKWEVDNWGAGWFYWPEYLPTGEELWQAGGASNPGNYDSAEANALIQATTTAPTAAAEITAIDKYENYLAEQLPVIWMPNAPQALTIYSSKLSGLVPQGIFDELYPEDYQLS
ncbi:MAG TPA: ABC transporter substrate-binding protein [Candidatus Acidoferrales bacterium]|nr:ABC transporter substrate-binding protein [Candidatus Acidoferrales bacterium]